MRHNSSDVIIAGVLSGAIAGVVTNGPEYLAVNKQTNPNFRVREFLKQPDAIRQLLFKGLMTRTIYYGSQACLMFYLLEEFKIFLRCSDLDD